MKQSIILIQIYKGLSLKSTIRLLLYQLQLKNIYIYHASRRILIDIYDLLKTIAWDMVFQEQLMFLRLCIATELKIVL